MESVISVEVPPAVPPYPGPNGLNSCTRYVPWFWILPISGPLTIKLISCVEIRNGKKYQALSATASSAALTQASRRAERRVSCRRSRQNTTSSSAISSQLSRWHCTSAAMPKAMGAHWAKRGFSVVYILYRPTSTNGRKVMAVYSPTEARM